MCSLNAISSCVCARCEGSSIAFYSFRLWCLSWCGELWAIWSLCILRLLQHDANLITYTNTLGARRMRRMAVNLSLAKVLPYVSFRLSPSHLSFSPHAWVHKREKSIIDMSQLIWFLFLVLDSIIHKHTRDGSAARLILNFHEKPGKISNFKSEILSHVSFWKWSCVF